MASQVNIRVPALVDKNKVVVPWSLYPQTLSESYLLGRDIKCKKNTGDDYYSAAEYCNEMPLPTLAELRHAYFDKDGKKFVSPESRQSMRDPRCPHEWTSTFLSGEREIVERPRKVVYINGIWVLENGRVITLDNFPEGKLPPDGWTTEYDKPTGFPSKTSLIREEAEEMFGDDASYFFAERTGIRAVFRYSSIGKGQFCVVANYEPDCRLPNTGGRRCLR